MPGLADPRHCGTLLFIGAATVFFVSVYVHRRHSRGGKDLCFHGLSSGGAISISAYR